MNDRDRFENMIRWYPASWRNRYGEELTTLLHDVHGMADIPLRDRLSLARRGAMERARASGLLRHTLEGGNRVRAGSLLVLWGWAIFMVAGAIVAKVGEHWESAIPAFHRSLPNDAYGALQLAGELGGLIVLAAAAISLPGLVGLLRAGKWYKIRRPTLRAMIAGMTAIAFTVAVVQWAHHLNEHNRNGGFFFHGLVFILWGLTMAVALGMATAAATAAARQISWSPRALQLVSGMAIALTVLMLVVMVGTIIWWSAMADFAPQFLGNGFLATSNVVPPPLAVAAILMILGLAVAAIGAIRIVFPTPEMVGERRGGPVS